MESHVSTLHCSFVVYLNKDKSLLPHFFANMNAFFEKIPLNYELLLILEKNSDCHEVELRANDQIRVYKNSKFLGRAESLRRFLGEAQSPICVVLTPELSSPLGDALKIFQYLMAEEGLALCWGERRSKKSPSSTKNFSPRQSLEFEFTKIIDDRQSTNRNDYFCELGGFKTQSWRDISSTLPAPISGWYLRPWISKIPQYSELTKQFVFVFDSGKTSPSYSSWKARWQMLKLAIFGI